MKVFQKAITGLDQLDELDFGFVPDLIMLFVSPEFLEIEQLVQSLNKDYPTSSITGCSTSGEISDVNVYDNSVSLNAIKFDSTSVSIVSVSLSDYDSSYEVGKNVSDSLASEDLKHILIFSDGIKVNGAELVRGLTQNTDTKISITGGLAGDGDRFGRTFTILNGEIDEGRILGIGLYGKNLKVGYSSKGGWDSFGLERLVTRATTNILYELDGKPALDTYKSFLGDKANDLPGSGLLFPISLRTGEDQKPVVRTILGVNEAEKSLTFAGDIPEGSYVRMMKANVDRLINGAEDSAVDCMEVLGKDAEFALLISCVGRRLVLKQIVEEEVEVVREVLGEKPVITGFYSYGELAPFGKFNPCQLHNQTMTITTFSEK